MSGWWGSSGRRTGEPVAEAAKRHGVSEQTIHTWRKRFGELRTEDVRRLHPMKTSLS